MYQYVNAANLEILSHLTDFQFRMFGFRVYLRNIFIQQFTPGISVMTSLYMLISFIALPAAGPVKASPRDTVYKYGDFLIEASDRTKINFIVKNASSSKAVSKGDTIYEGENYLILGDQKKTSIHGVYRKFKLKYKFSQFPAFIYKGKPASPDFKTDPKARPFRTQNRGRCREKGINFAGHNTIVIWGCGSPCQSIAVMDRIDGKIYYSSLQNRDISFGIECTPDSRMLLLNADLLGAHEGYAGCSNILKPETREWVNHNARRLAE